MVMRELSALVNLTQYYKVMRISPAPQWQCFRKVSALIHTIVASVTML